MVTWPNQTPWWILLLFTVWFSIDVGIGELTLPRLLVTCAKCYSTQRSRWEWYHTRFNHKAVQFSYIYKVAQAILIYVNLIKCRPSCAWFDWWLCDMFWTENWQSWHMARQDALQCQTSAMSPSTTFRQGMRYAHSVYIISHHHTLVSFLILLVTVAAAMSTTLWPRLTSWQPGQC